MSELKTYVTDLIAKCIDDSCNCRAKCPVARGCYQIRAIVETDPDEEHKIIASRCATQATAATSEIAGIAFKYAQDCLAVEDGGPRTENTTGWKYNRTRTTLAKLAGCNGRVRFKPVSRRFYQDERFATGRRGARYEIIKT